MFLLLSLLCGILANKITSTEVTKEIVLIGKDAVERWWKNEVLGPPVVRNVR